MGVYLAVYSPTGHTLKALKALSKPFGEGEIIDLCAPKGKFVARTLKKDDLLFCAVPSYSGRMPAVAAKRLERITGDAAGAVLLVCYGNRAYEDTLLEMGDLLSEKGFRIIAGCAAVTEHSVCRKVSPGRPGKKDLAELEGFGEKIREKIQKGSFREVKLPGKRPYKAAKAHFPFVPERIKRACTQCGLCRNLCPSGAINSALETDAEACTSCLKCIALCPEGARQLPEQMTMAVYEKLGSLPQKDNALFIS